MATVHCSGRRAPLAPGSARGAFETARQRPQDAEAKRGETSDPKIARPSDGEWTDPSDIGEGRVIDIQTPEDNGNWAALIQPIPEPATISLFGLAVGRRTRRR